MSDLDRLSLTAYGSASAASRHDTGVDASADGVQPVPPVVRVAPPTPSSPSRGPWRWLIALFATAFLLVGTLSIAAFAKSSPTSLGPTFLPADTVVYAEARLDLPGDQRDQLMAFLGHLPGFADPAAFDNKVDQTLDQLLGGSDAPISWTEDIKPWFSGQIMLGVPSLPDMSDTTTAGAPSAPIIAALGVTDRAALDATLVKLLGTMGDKVTSVAHGDSTISVIDGGDGSVTALAPTDELLLISNDPEQLKVALDVVDGTLPSLADDPDFQTAFAALPADRLGAFVLDTAQLKDVLGPLLESQFASQPQLAALAPQITAALGMLPATVTGHIRVDGDHLTARIDAIGGGSLPTLSVRTTDLASWMPADTIAYLETRDLGTAIKTIVQQFKPIIAQGDNGKSIGKIEDLLGTDLESYLDWVGDVAIGVSHGEAGPSVGIVATVTDEVLAQQRVDSLLTIVRALAATADSSPVTMSHEDVNGVTVTTIALTDAAGVPSDLPVEPRISVALTDGHLILGLGDFAKQTLTRDAANTLATSPSYTKALAAVTPENAGLVFVDVAAALAFLEPLMSSSDRANFETQIKPFAESLDFLVGSLDQDATSSSASVMLFVK